MVQKTQHFHNAPWIIFDMDEVIVNIRDRLADHLNQATGKNIPASAWYQHDLEGIYGIDSKQLIDIFFSSRILETATLEPDADKALNNAKNFGYNVGILTARGWHHDGLNISQQTVTQFQLPVDHIVAVPLHAKKHEVIRQAFPGGPVIGFVDDNPAHVRGVSTLGIPTFVRDRPWNTDMLEYARVHNLEHFVDSVHNQHLTTRQSSDLSPGF